MWKTGANLNILSTEGIGAVNRMSSTNNNEVPSWKPRQPIRVRFGEHLKEFRMSRGFTQDQLAMMSGLHRTFISDMERGAKEPSLHTVEVIAACFKMSVSDMLRDLDRGL
jgi:DNA-binding XRE family transcriptional regulator